MNTAEISTYDCDTRPYWTPEGVSNASTRKWGSFNERGTAYRIDDPDTPRPWLNYLCNDVFGSVVSNRGMGFCWLESCLLRITKYDHPVDYLPRDFSDGRMLLLERPGRPSVNLLQDVPGLVCVHHPAKSEFRVELEDLRFQIDVFVPPDIPGEVWRVSVHNRGKHPQTLRLGFGQIWSIATFGIHTAEEGIPYTSVPGTSFASVIGNGCCQASSTEAALPFPVHVLFGSPGAAGVEITPEETVTRKGQTFRFHRVRADQQVALSPDEAQIFLVFSGASRNKESLLTAWSELQKPGAGSLALRRAHRVFARLKRRISCALPDCDLQNFLNSWFKHQLHLTFHFTRSGHSGYRDSVQDTWGYTLLDPPAARKRLVQILSHLRADGTAPRQFSNFGDGKHDHRNFMDSGVWIAEAMADYLRETGDWALMDESIPYLDGGAGSVEEHVWRAGQALFDRRGNHGACLTGDGDWNDALEGISRDGDAVSMWLTIALFHSHRQLLSVYRFLGNEEKCGLIEGQLKELRHVIETAGWDGSWYVYGFTGTGKPIGSRKNREGQIHLNAQTWAAFSGAADPERAHTAMRSADRLLNTPRGAALLAPPYVHEAEEVGRIARLEPGTFENGAVYIHAVAFQVRAYLSLGRHEDAWRTLMGVLPTNPDNPDEWRTSEPYATGNYTCGPGHVREGQNFFTWFTGNPAWFLRIGFDELLGVKAGFDGLRIHPGVPPHWSSYSVVRVYRGCRYVIRFERADVPDICVRLEGVEQPGLHIPVQTSATAEIQVLFPPPPFQD